MLKWLTPDLFLDELQALSSAPLRQWGVRGLIFDLDNTLLPYDSYALTAEVLALVEELRDSGYAMCLVSNSNRDRRVKSLGEQAGVAAISRAGKPRRRAFREALALLGTSPEETAAVGDQVFTDVLGANRLGLYSVLVKPLSPTEFIGTRLVRRLEHLVLETLRRRGELYRLEPRLCGESGEGSAGR